MDKDARIDELKRELAELKSKLPSRKEGLCGQKFSKDPIEIIQRIEDAEEELEKLQKGEQENGRAGE